MEDTYIGECKVCNVEIDLINGICQECVLTQQKEDLKKTIDRMSYKSMLSRWRFAPSGDPMFQGEVGEYFSEVMKKKRPENSAKISKEIGW